LRFTPDAGFAGVGGLSLSVDDLGNTGAGGALAASGNVSITVAVNPPAPPVPGVPWIPDLPPLPPPELAPAPTDPVATPADPPLEDATGTPGESVPGGGGIVEEAAASPGFEPSSRSAAPARSETSSGGHGGSTAYGGADPRLLFAAEGSAEIAASAFGFGTAGADLQAASSALQSQALLDGMDRLRADLQEEARVEYNAVALTTAASLGLSVGYVLWLLRGGILVGSMLSSMPAWRFVDPLPILGRLDEDDDADEADESLASMVERTNREGGAQPAPA
jgi:hypothetical protein